MSLSAHDFYVLSITVPLISLHLCETRSLQVSTRTSTPLGRDLNLLYSLTHHQSLKQCLVHSRDSINICRNICCYRSFLSCHLWGARIKTVIIWNTAWWDPPWQLWLVLLFLLCQMLLFNYEGCKVTRALSAGVVWEPGSHKCGQDVVLASQADEPRGKQTVLPCPSPAPSSCLLCSSHVPFFFSLGQNCWKIITMAEGRPTWDLSICITTWHFPKPDDIKC